VRRLGGIVILLLATRLVGPLTALLAQEWPQFRGPGGQGQSSERGLPLAWSESKNIAWKVPVPGRGRSCPADAFG
jgi:outer membrane protein assembly factor BamB